jgi:hypothetical protein
VVHKISRCSELIKHPSIFTHCTKQIDQEQHRWLQMSLITTVIAWLFQASNSAEDSSLTTDQPCRYRLDNDSSATLTLPDGRKLGYAQYGSPNGKAILYHHGFPGSRIEAAAFHELSSELGLRMIAIDRPGHGWSSPHPASKLLDWPKDVERLTEHLGLESYSVLVCTHVRNFLKGF